MAVNAKKVASTRKEIEAIRKSIAIFRDGLLGIDETASVERLAADAKLRRLIRELTEKASFLESTIARYR